MSFLNIFKKKYKKKEHKKEFGFFTFVSHKYDGPFTENVFFKKEVNESWEKALKNAIINKEKNEKINHPITITFFTKL